MHTPLFCSFKWRGQSQMHNKQLVSQISKAADELVLVLILHLLRCKKSFFIRYFINCGYKLNHLWLCMHFAVELTVVTLKWIIDPVDQNVQWIEIIYDIINIPFHRIVKSEPCILKVNPVYVKLGLVLVWSIYCTKIE